LIGAAVTLQHFHVARVRRGAVERLRREAHLAHLLGQRRVFQICEAGAMFALIEEQVPQTLRLRLLLQLFDDRHDDPGIALLARVVHLMVIGLFGRIDVRVHEIADALQPLLLPW
jgi:hypothetical protein